MPVVCSITAEFGRADVAVNFQVEIAGDIAMDVAVMTSIFDHVREALASHVHALDPQRGWKFKSNESFFGFDHVQLWIKLGMQRASIYSLRTFITLFEGSKYAY